MAEEDIIFGKNRHFFGGIEPSNMKRFEAKIENGSVKLFVELPNDTEINNQVLCTVEGAIIRRSLGRFPENEFDGDLVVDIKESITYIDDNVDISKPYFYSAFPYTSQGVYNRNDTNRTSINTPNLLLSFEIPTIQSVILNFTIPEGYSKVVIRKGIYGYPENENDGEDLGTYSESGYAVDDVIDMGCTYSYSFFLQDVNGEYIRDQRNRLLVTVPSVDYLFGYDIDLSDSNPETRVSYPSDVDNYGYTPVLINKNTYSLDAGSWDLTPGKYFMPRPCMLSLDGEVLYYLDPDDFGLKEDGTPSDVASSTAILKKYANAMMEWPKIYTKRWETDGVYHFRCSNIAYDSEWDCWCNYDKNDNIIEHFYTSIYLGSVSLVDGKTTLRSISGGSPSVSEGAREYIEWASNNGSDWYTSTLVDLLLIQDLLVLLGKSTNCQKVFGFGFSQRTEYNGQLDSKGMFYGSNNTSNAAGYAVKVFGMEHFWGSKGKYIAGLGMKQSKLAVKLTRGTHDGTTVSDYNVTFNGYNILQDAVSVGSGYINSMITKPYGRLPCTNGGSSSTFECDIMQLNAPSNYTAYTRVSSSSSYPYDQGPFGIDVYFSPDSYGQELCAALSCKPSLKTK